MKFLGIALCLLATPCAAQVIITDGDTLRLNGKRIRLAGIDAPELRQQCTDGWEAGQSAARMLRRLVEGYHVKCEGSQTDVFGRTIAVCFSDNLDLSAAMVRGGMARAYVKYSKEYVPQEQRARAAKLGIWAHDCEAPWVYRHRQEKR